MADVNEESRSGGGVGVGGGVGGVGGGGGGGGGRGTSLSIFISGLHNHPWNRGEVKLGYTDSRVYYMRGCRGHRPATALTALTALTPLTHYNIIFQPTRLPERARWT